MVARKDRLPLPAPLGGERPAGALDVADLQPVHHVSGSPDPAVAMIGGKAPIGEPPLALGQSQRSVQRSLDALALERKVQSFGRGPAKRWMTPPLPGFATTLLLPTSLPGD